MSIASNGAAIRAEHVSRHYQMGSALIRAVDDVTLEVGAGEFLALLGTSGSGKSTLLNLMAGLDRPSAGSIVAHGRNLSELNSIELAQYRSRTVGMVFQSFNLLPKMTLEENVELPLRLAEVDRSERGARVREALERVGLDEARDSSPQRIIRGRTAADGDRARSCQPAYDTFCRRAHGKSRQCDGRIGDATFEGNSIVHGDDDHYGDA